MNILERAAKLQDEIHENITKDILVGVGVDNYNTLTNYMYMKHRNGKNAFNLQKKTDKEILEIAIKMCEPNYTKITTICLDIIGKEVYVDKEIAITINSISRDSEGNNIVTSFDGISYNADNLYIRR